MQHPLAADIQSGGHVRIQVVDALPEPGILSVPVVGAVGLPDIDFEEWGLFGGVVPTPADLPENSMFWVFAALNDMCDNDREHYGVNVRAFWEAYQTALIAAANQFFPVSSSPASASRWYVPHVAYAVENNLMLGRSATTFDPAATASGSQAGRTAHSAA